MSSFPWWMQVSLGGFSSAVWIKVWTFCCACLSVKKHNCVFAFNLIFDFVKMILCLCTEHGTRVARLVILVSKRIPALDPNAFWTSVKWGDGSWTVYWFLRRFPSNMEDVMAQLWMTGFLSGLVVWLQYNNLPLGVCAAVKVDYSSLVFWIPPMNKN